MSKFSEKREEQATAASSGPRWLWVGIALVIAVVGWGAYYFLYFQKPVSTLDGFAKCLNAKGATLYGICKQAGVKNFPTWQFADGSRMEGPQPLAVLGDKAGCRLP